MSLCFGAGNQNRTDDLVITNDVLYRLSHTSDLVIISKKIGFVKSIFKLYFIFFEKIYFFIDFVTFSCYNIPRKNALIGSSKGKSVFRERTDGASSPRESRKSSVSGAGEDDFCVACNGCSVIAF